MYCLSNTSNDSIVNQKLVPVSNVTKPPGLIGLPNAVPTIDAIVARVNIQLNTVKIDNFVVIIINFSSGFNFR